MQNIYKELVEIKMLLKELIITLDSLNNRPVVNVTRRVPWLHTRVVGERVRLR